MIVKLKGRLGNQMFQYAFGRSVALARKEELVFTRDAFKQDPIWCYALDVFGLPIDFSPRTPTGVFNEGEHFPYNPAVLTAPAGMLFDGYWQTEKYFNPTLVYGAFFRRDMSDQSNVVANEIKLCGGHSAFLHVRRTDYIAKKNPDGTFLDNTQYYRALSTEHYSAAIKLIRDTDSAVKFFVFSDDPEWCKSAFPEFHVVDHNKPGGEFLGPEASCRAHEDMWLMSLCQHGIIANSSFSWWGAWLGGSRPGRIIITPRQWFGPKYAALDTRDLIPDKWTKL